jgi:hypothetical protein
MTFLMNRDQRRPAIAHYTDEGYDLKKYFPKFAAILPD